MLIQRVKLSLNLDGAAETDSKDHRWQASPHSRFERLLRETQVPSGCFRTAPTFRSCTPPVVRFERPRNLPRRALTEVAGRSIFAALHMLLCAAALQPARTSGACRRILGRQPQVSESGLHQARRAVLAALYELLRGFQAADDQRHGGSAPPRARRTTRTTCTRACSRALAAGVRPLMPKIETFCLPGNTKRILTRSTTTTTRSSDCFIDFAPTPAAIPTLWTSVTAPRRQLLMLCRLIYDGARHGGLPRSRSQGVSLRPRSVSLPRRSPQGQTSAGEPRPTDLPHVSDGVVFRVLQNLLILDGEPRLTSRSMSSRSVASTKPLWACGSKSHRGPVDRDQAGQARTRCFRPPEGRSGSATSSSKPAIASRHGSARPYRSRLLGQGRRDAEGMPRRSRIYSLLDTDPDRLSRHALVVSEGGDGPPAVRRTSPKRFTLYLALAHRADRPHDPPADPGSPRLKPHPRADPRPEDLRSGDGLRSVPGSRLPLSRRVAGESLARPQMRTGHPARRGRTAPRPPHRRPALLYGVDKNPMAVDLAKLSLWLATLAKDHPFTFLDHALRCGDSLVGLRKLRSSASTGNPNGSGTSLGRPSRGSSTGRWIRADRSAKRPTGRPKRLYASGSGRRRVHRPGSRYGDLVLSAFFAADNDREAEGAARVPRRRPRRPAQPLRRCAPSAVRRRSRRAPRRSSSGRSVPLGDRVSRGLRSGPIAGSMRSWATRRSWVRTRWRRGMRRGYPDWLRRFRTNRRERRPRRALLPRAFNLLRRGGAFGLIATNTIGQGDTRTHRPALDLQSRRSDLRRDPTQEVAGQAAARQRRQSRFERRR